MGLIYLYPFNYKEFSLIEFSMSPSSKNVLLNNLGSHYELKLLKMYGFVASYVAI